VAYEMQVLFVIIALVVLWCGLGDGWLARMPGGYWWTEHAHLVVLCLLPLSWGWWVVPFWAFGVYAYADDFYQHRRRIRPGEENYRSPLHLWAWYTLRLDKVYEWLGIDR